MLYYLPPAEIRSVAKWIEDGALIAKSDGTILGSEGNKVIIRRAVRRSLRRVTSEYLASVSQYMWVSKPLILFCLCLLDQSLAIHDAVSATESESSDSLKDGDDGEALPSPVSAASPTEFDFSNHDDGTVIIHLDNVLEYTMDLLLDRGIALEEECARLFQEADANNDGKRNFLHCCVGRKLSDSCDRSS